MARDMKQRLDRILVERGFFHSRSQAAAAVLSGQVCVDGIMVTKAGQQVGEEARIEVKGENRFVSRGGLKLERAFEAFRVDVEGKAVLDGGASSGGFSDCLLQHGARKVIAVDVGYGQLDWRLRQDPRVEVLERTNIRYLKPEQLSEKPTFAVLDLSFISIKKVIGAVIECLQPGFEAVILVKPQFEAGRGQVGKGGVVREIGVHRQVLEGTWDFLTGSGMSVRGLIDSGVRGPKGNVEYLLYAADGRDGKADTASPDRDGVIEDLLETVGALLNQE